MGFSCAAHAERPCLRSHCRDRSSKAEGAIQVNRLSMSFSVVIVSAVLLAVVACGETGEPSRPATPLPAVPAPTQVPEAAITPVAQATPIPPVPAATSLPAAPAPTSAPNPTPSPASTAVRLTTPTPVPTPIPAVFPLTVIDSNGNEVVFEEPPERIVAFDSAVVETLFAIGEGHRVVGTHDFVTYPPETAEITRVGGAFNMNIEATVVLEPDLVFIFFDANQVDLERAGLKVLYLRSLGADFSKIADNIRLWGRIVGNPSAAEGVAADFEARLEEIKSVMARYASGPSVFQDEGALWTPGPDTLMGEVFELLKLQNIAHDISGYAQLSPEVIVERGPQVVIASYGDQISGNPAFSDLPAVRNNRIFVPSSDALSIAGPRFIAGIGELARWVYPGIFE